MYSAHPESSVLEAPSAIAHAEGRENHHPLESHQAYLKSMANARIGSTIKAYVSPSDVVQSTFASAYRRLAKPDVLNIRNLRNWLAGILMNKIREAARKYGRGKQDPPRPGPIDWTIAGHPRGGSGERSEKPVDDADTFTWAMSLLPENQRRVVELHLLHHLEMDEIVNVLGITEACARKRYERATKFLGDRIDPREYR
jgi:RNA polymerase sigma factor (sigma-70 family)